MTTKTARHPRRMTRDASHVLIAMGQVICVRGYVAPRHVVFANGFRVTRFLVVIARVRSDGVEGLRHAPPATGHDHRVLHDVAGFEIDVAVLFVLSLAITRYPLKQRYPAVRFIPHAYACEVLPNQRLVLRLPSLQRGSGHRRSRRAGREEHGLLFDRAVAILACDLNRGTRFVVEIPVAVRVLAEVTIDAMHAAFKMDVAEMNRLAELRGIVSRHDVSAGVEQVAFAIAFEYFA